MTLDNPISLQGSTVVGLYKVYMRLHRALWRGLGLKLPLEQGLGRRVLGSSGSL